VIESKNLNSKEISNWKHFRKIFKGVERWKQSLLKSMSLYGKSDVNCV